MGQIQQGLKERSGKQAALQGQKPDLGAKAKSRPGGNALDRSDALLDEPLGLLYRQGIGIVIRQAAGRCGKGSWRHDGIVILANGCYCA